MNTTISRQYRETRISAAYQQGYNSDPVNPYVYYRTDYERRAYILGLEARRAGQQNCYNVGETEQ